MAIYLAEALQTINLYHTINPEPMSGTGAVTLQKAIISLGLRGDLLLY